MQRKKTLLLIHALETSGPEDREKIHAIFSKEHIGRDDVRRVRAIFERTGTLEAAEKMVQKHVETARKNLSALPESEGKANLNAFLDLVSRRNS
jgi:geranylgeranyl pyrophosphate synthase